MQGDNYFFISLFAFAIFNQHFYIKEKEALSEAFSMFILIWLLYEGAACVSTQHSWSLELQRRLFGGRRICCCCRYGNFSWRTLRWYWRSGWYHRCRCWGTSLADENWFHSPPPTYFLFSCLDLPIVFAVKLNKDVNKYRSIVRNREQQLHRTHTATFRYNSFLPGARWPTQVIVDFVHLSPVA